ncbi:MAG: sarcosine oxidase subunit gamma [Rhodobacteraceae bacterium]|nr:sarcosine oxidase subunit gamma [Paracoccaceae bacterium]
MSEVPQRPRAVSALGGISRSGFATVTEAGLRGMITVRGDLASRRMAAAVKAATGTAVPPPRRIVTKDDRAALWMSPDELMILVPHADAPRAAATLSASLAGEHALVADVSDARTTFTITGPKADQVLRKLTPADLDRLAEGEVRRTRIAQVAGAFWRSAPEEFTLVTFRSVAAYVMALLETASRAGTELDRADRRP